MKISRHCGVAGYQVRIRLSHVLECIRNLRFPFPTRDIICPKWNLLIHILGAGKTTIAAITSESLQKSFANESSIAVASIYCNYKDKTAQTPTTLLASIWSQIRREGTLDPEVEALYDRQPNSSPRLEDVCKILRAEVRLHELFFCHSIMSVATHVVRLDNASSLLHTINVTQKRGMLNTEVRPGP